MMTTEGRVTGIRRMGLRNRDQVITFQQETAEWSQAASRFMNQERRKNPTLFLDKWIYKMHGKY